MIVYATSWSGGKDSCFALWKALSQGLEVKYLVNFINADSTSAMSHGLTPDLIKLQAQAMQLPVLQQRVTRDNYEAGFRTALEGLKLKGINGLITGDIYLQGHRDWINRVCGEVNVEAVLPLWQMNTFQLLADFIEAGFKAIVVSVKAKLLGKEWLGRQIDSKLVNELRLLARSSEIDPCGEGGEFHSFVYDGPLFKKSIKIIDSMPVLRDDRWFLNIMEYGLG